ncbi:MAG: hypothetical protein ACR2P1_16090 [Pseudomonadales bacterium]
MRKVVILCCILVLSSCANQSSRWFGANAWQADNFNTALRFFDVDFKKQLQRYAADELIIWFPLITGNFYGLPNEDAILKPELDSKLRFKFALRTITSRIDQLARAFPADSGELKIEPVDTRVARLGTFVINPNTGETIGPTAWVDANNTYIMMLVYFDRACEINGRLEQANKTYIHDIKIPGPGFYWLRRSSNSKTRVRIVAAAPPRTVYLGVTPLDFIAI